MQRRSTTIIDQTEKAGRKKRERVVAVVLAAGKGTRMGTEIPKQFAEVEGRTVLSHTVKKFERHAEIDAIVVICGRGTKGTVAEICREDGFKKVRKIAVGGRTRRESSMKGILAAEKLCGDGIVLIHDCARPNVSAKVISDNIRLARKFGACVTAARSVDTVITSVDGQLISNIIPRDTVWTVQTPQTFRIDTIRRAHANFEEKATAGEAVPEITDDGGLVRFMGGDVAICESGRDNFKLTVPGDMELFRTILKSGGGQ